MGRKKRRKGQLSIETLLIYGTVLLVATLAISALVYFGVLDLGGLLPDKCQTGSELVCENYVATVSGDSLQLELRNQVGRNIVLDQVQIQGQEDWDQTNYDSGAGLALSVNSGSLSPVISVARSGATGPTPASGDKYKGQVVVTYSVVGSSIAQTKTGTILVTFT